MGLSRTLTRTSTPTTSELFDVATDGSTNGGGTYVVGAGGLLLERRSDEYGTLLETGLVGNGRNLRGVATTDDGARVWVVGDSGAFGYYDTAADDAVDHSRPDGHSTTFRDVTVAGPAGSERVVAVDGSGQAFALSVDGTGTTVEGITKPGDGSALTAVCGDGPFYAVDSVGCAYRSPDGLAFERRELADQEFVGLAARGGALETVTPSGDFVRYQFDGGTKRVLDVGTNGLTDLAADGTALVAGSQGHLYAEREGISVLGVDVSLSGLLSGGSKTAFSAIETAVTVDFNAVGAGGRTVAVGENGVVVESA